jgi:hypothetical protein
MLSILYMPVWVQITLFVLAVLRTQNRLLLFIPAIIADIIYAPTAAFSIYNLKTTIFVAALLITHYIIMSRTRASQLTYGLAQK